MTFEENGAGDSLEMRLYATQRTRLHSLSVVC